MLRSKRLFTALTTTLLALAPLTAHAGANYEAVWYPDGTIRWFNKNVVNAGTSGSRITSAMAFLAEHSPLDIDESSTEAAANLTFQEYAPLSSGSGMCYAYWDEHRSDANKHVEFSPEGSISMGTVLHEVRHALGFPHEFQRDDRDSFVDVCFNVDPFNYGKMGSAYWPDPYNNLSPFDFASVMSHSGSGYSSCVSTLPGVVEQTRSYRGHSSDSPLSIHDINSVYRVYANNLGANLGGDRFGHAVATGDYDDDGIEDIAIASTDPSGSDYYVSVFFFRGVQTNETESGVGTRYIPWFREGIETTSTATARVALASGDFNGDGITDLAVGEPWYNSNRGRVKVLFVNRGPDDISNTTDSRAPWGRRGVRATKTIVPSDVGLSSLTHTGRFGASLAAATLTSNKTATYPRHELIIGIPRASVTDKLTVTSTGAIAIIKGASEPTVANWTVLDHEVVYGSGGSGGEFGYSVSAIPGLCNNGVPSSNNNDGFIVGAPGEGADAGAVYVYGCATDAARALITPALISTVTGGNAAARYGAAVAGFRRRMTSPSIPYKYYAAVGAPDYTGSGTNPKSGIAFLDEYSTGGVKTYIDSFRPSTRSNNDEFGHSLAVQQNAVSSTSSEAGREVYIAVGMPGTEVSGVVAGKVYVWRPWNSDGTLTGTASVISPTSPSSTSDTRFGEALATLRNLDSQGGFVAGAPESRESDGVEAGSADVLLNDASSSWDWSTWRSHRSQESEGDHRPTN